MQRSLTTSNLSLPAEESQAKRRARKGDGAALGKVQHVALDGVHFVAVLVANVELAINNHLHLMVVVGVNQRGALLLAVEARGDRRAVVWVWLYVLKAGCTTAGNVAEEGVVVCDERWREGRGCAGEVGEWLRGSRHFAFGAGLFGSSRVGFGGSELTAYQTAITRR